MSLKSDLFEFNPARTFLLTVVLLLAIAIGAGLGLGLGPQDDGATFVWTCIVNGFAIVLSAVLMLTGFETRAERPAPGLGFLKIGSLAIAIGSFAFSIGLSLANACEAARVAAGTY